MVYLYGVPARVRTAPMVFFGALVTKETAASPILRSRALKATKLGVS